MMADLWRVEIDGEIEHLCGRCAGQRKRDGMSWASYCRSCFVRQTFEC